MFLDKLLACVGANTIRHGAVVGKNHYAPNVETPSAEVVGHEWFIRENSATIECWSLSVRGVGRVGSTVTQEIYVDEMQFNNTALGDSWTQETTKRGIANVL